MSIYHTENNMYVSRILYEATMRNEPQAILARPKTSIPAGENIFRHDLSNMGTSITKDWMMMHSTEHSDRALPGMYLHNIVTGQNIALDILSEKPRVRKLVYLVTNQPDKENIFALRGQGMYHLVAVRKDNNQPASIFAGNFANCKGTLDGIEFETGESKTAARAPIMEIYFVYDKVGIHHSVTLDQIDSLREYEAGDWIEEDRLNGAINTYKQYLQNLSAQPQCQI